MKTLLIPAAALALLAPGEELSTDYSKAGTLRIETASQLSMETTSFSMELDGEPVDNPRGGGGGGTTESRRVVHIDEFLEQSDGAPTHVRRSFESIESTGTRMGRDGEMEFETECPLDSVTLDLVLQDGDVLVEVTDGVEPDDEATLEGHQLDLDLDALLPEGGVEVGDTWDLEPDAARRALGMHVQPALFPRPQREEDGGGGERGGGRRGGGRRGGGGGTARLLAGAEWDGKATVEAVGEEHDGVSCVVILIELECEGEMPEFGGGGRGGRGGGGGFAPMLSRSSLENDFQVEAEGRLYFSIADQRPIAFELEGKLETNRTMERETQRGDMYMSTTQEGTFTYSVTISPGSNDQ